MSRTGPIPNAVFAFIAAVEGMEMRESVCAVIQTITTACFSDTPIPTLNKRIGQLLRQHPEYLLELADWLWSVETRKVAQASGAHWAWLEWCRAANRLYFGAVGSVAFGADQPGRPALTGFSPYEDAAFLAEHLNKNKKVASSEAELQAAGSIGRELDLREVQRHRRKLRDAGATSDELTEQNAFIRVKYVRKS